MLYIYYTLYIIYYFIYILYIIYYIYIYIKSYIKNYMLYILDLKLGRNLSIFSVYCEFRQDLLPAEPAVCVPVQSTIAA